MSDWATTEVVVKIMETHDDANLIFQTGIIRSVTVSFSAQQGVFILLLEYKLCLLNVKISVLKCLSIAIRTSGDNLSGYKNIKNGKHDFGLIFWMRFLTNEPSKIQRALFQPKRLLLVLYLNGFHFYLFVLLL